MTTEIEQISAPLLKVFPEAVCFEVDIKYFPMARPFVIVQFPHTKSPCLSNFYATEKEAWQNAVDRYAVEIMVKNLDEKINQLPKEENEYHT